MKVIEKIETKYKTEEAEILNSLFHFPSYQENRISGATVKPSPASSLPFPPIRFFYGQLPPPDNGHTIDRKTFLSQ